MISLPVASGRRCCCSAPAEPADSPSAACPPRRSWRRRGLELAGWLIPGTLLALFPKCPLCVAGYIALATGLGVSLTVATYLRWGLLVFCVAALLFMAVRMVTRTIATRQTKTRRRARK